MKMRCRNCAYNIDHCNNGWCTQHLKYVNKDSCCIKYKRKLSISPSSLLALVISAIGLVVSLLALMNVI
jgi:hypothetical protein